MKVNVKPGEYIVVTPQKKWGRARDAGTIMLTDVRLHADGTITGDAVDNTETPSNEVYPPSDHLLTLFNEVEYKDGKFMHGSQDLTDAALRGAYVAGTQVWTTKR